MTTTTVKLSRRDFLKGGGGVALGGLMGLGMDLAPVRAASARLKIEGAQEFPSVCPYCAVGCGLLISSRDKQVINIEGNPDSPINRGTLCPKGAATYQLAVNPNRVTKVLHRAPGATDWEEMSLDAAMDRIAELTKQTRDASFTEFFDGTDTEGNPAQKRVNHTLAIGSLGGATMDNEWNYVQAKLMRSLGVVYIENQARI